MNGLSFTIGLGSVNPQQQREHEAAPACGQAGGDSMAGAPGDGRDRRYGAGREDGGPGYQQQQQQQPHQHAPHLPSQYQHFQSFGPPSGSMHAIAHPHQGYSPLTSLHPPPPSSSLSQQQHQNHTAQQHFPSPPNPHNANAPQWYDFANQQPDSPAQPHQQQQMPLLVPTPINRGGYPRRRDSMPEILGSVSPDVYMGRGGGLPVQTSPYDGMSRMRGYVNPPLRDEMMPLAGAMSTVTGGAQGGPSFGSWQRLVPGMPQGDSSHASTSMAATVDPTATIPESGQRSRPSTMGSSFVDEDGPGTRPGTGTTVGTDTAQSRQLSDEPMVAWEDIPPSSRPDSSARGWNKGKGKSVGDEVDDTMDLDGGEGGDEKIDHRKRKRNRTIRSCVPCHNHKRKCDRKRPCGRCTALGLTGTCVYEIDEARDMNDPDAVEQVRLKKRIAELEQVVRELRQNAPSRNAFTRVPPPQPLPSGPPPIALSSAAPVPTCTSGTLDDAENSGKKRRVIVDRFARFKLDEAKAVENDARSWYSDRPPDFVKVKAEWAPDKASDALEEEARKGEDAASAARASTDVSSDKDKEDYMAEPYSTHLLPGEEIVYDSSGRQVFLGASAGKSMLRRLRELASSKKDGQLLAVPENVAFTGVFPNLRKTFPFTTIWSHENFCAEIIGLLPNREQSELLWEAWEANYQLYFSPFHLPTLKAEHTKFFQQPTSEKMNIPLSSLAVFLMICALGCLKRATSAEIFGHPDRDMAAQANKAGTEVTSPKDLTSSRLQSELYLSAAYQALRLCSFMANPSVHTLQCQLLIEVYLLASERAADAWAVGGNMIKQAIALGLHKDPLSLDPTISMRDAEVKRRLWWSIAGFDCMLCVFFGRPCGISYYTTNLPQDRPDENLSDAPGSAQQLLPPSNVLVNETTDQTFHAAYYQLTIPSFELLERIFHVDRRISRSAIYGWFSPPPENSSLPEESPQHTYQDAIRLGHDISQWYAHLPRGMRFDADDTPEYMLENLTMTRINQVLGLCIKSWTLVLVLHRPYLRVDPAAYPESTESCSQAAHMILQAYRAMSTTKSALSWILWTMSYRAFQAGAVCAFLALRQPGTELAAKCLEDLRGAIQVFEDRLQSWNSTHPVQGDLCEGLVQLEKLVTASTRQRQSPLVSTVPLLNRSSPAMGVLNGGNGMEQTLFGLSPAMYGQFDQSRTPLAHIKAFPSSVKLPAADDGVSRLYTGNFSGGGGDDHGDGTRADPMQAALGAGSIPQPAESLSGTGTFASDFNGPGPLALPGFWASMFGIKMEKDADSLPLEEGSWS